MEPEHEIPERRGQQPQSVVDGMVWVDGVLYIRVSTRWLDEHGDERVLRTSDAARVVDEAARLVVCTPDGESRELPTRSAAVRGVGGTDDRVTVRAQAEGRFTPSEVGLQGPGGTWYVCVQPSSGGTHRVRMSSGSPSRPAIVGGVPYLARCDSDGSLLIEAGDRARLVHRDPRPRIAAAEVESLAKDDARHRFQVSVPLSGIRVSPVGTAPGGGIVAAGTAELVAPSHPLVRRLLPRARPRTPVQEAQGDFRLTTRGDEAVLHVELTAVPGLWQVVLRSDGSRTPLPLRLRIRPSGSVTVLAPASHRAVADVAAPPRVSVIVPVHNGEDTVEDAIRSVFLQTLPQEDIEIIAVDDGSSDSSAAILRRLEREQPGMRVLTQPASGTAAAPRNAGIESARGRHLFFLDADDLLTPTSLEKMTEVADALDADVVLGKLEGFAGRQRVPRRIFSQTSVDADVVANTLMGSLGPTKLFRTELINSHQIRFPLGLRAGEDQAFVAEALLTARRIVILADTVYYRIRGHGPRPSSSTQVSKIDIRLKRAGLLAGVISRHTEPGERRDALLPRPFGERALEGVFREEFLELESSARMELIERVGSEFGHLWTPGLRARLTPQARLLYDFVFRRDLARLTALLEHARGDVRRLPVLADENGFYLDTPASVREELDLEDLRVGAPPIAHRLIKLTSGNGAVIALARIRLRKPGPVPFGVHAEWRLRTPAAQMTDVVEARTDVLGRPPDSSWKDAVPFSIRTEIDALPDTGVWDLWIAPVWGETMGTASRFGGVRSTSIDTRPTVITDPPALLMFSGRAGHLAIDRRPPPHRASPIARS